MDSRQSGVKECARQAERVQLPRPQTCYGVPIRRDERRYFVVRHRSICYVYRRSPMGSRLAPLIWARVAALLTRLTQSLFDLSWVRIETFVDDPIVVIRGTPTSIRHHVASVVLLWLAMGVPLALSKAQLATTV
eukprot:372397-Amphidinium_carterae.1